MVRWVAGKIACGAGDLWGPLGATDSSLADVAGVWPRARHQSALPQREGSS